MSFLTLSKGVEIYCTFNDFTWYPISAGSVYNCYNAQVSISNSATTLESVRGVHQSGKSNTDVKVLYVEEDKTGIERLPSNIEKFFPNLVLIRWVRGSIRTVTAEDLRPFPELTGFSMFYNRIVSLDGDLFQYTPKLEWVDFERNQIANVGEDLLANLENLKRVWFHANTCIDSSAESPQAIQELKQALLTQCPFLVTTQTSSTTDDCNVRCTVNEEIDGLTAKLGDQSRINDEFQETIQNSERRIHALEDLVAKSDERILELEKQVREILSLP